jgi:hypothetical protein
MNNEDYNAVLKALPDMSGTEKDIAMQCLNDGYSVGETIDHILYGSIGGYSLEEYIQDVTDYPQSTGPESDSSVSPKTKG